MKRILLLAIIHLLALKSLSQERQTQNLIIVTLDGFRWQELFQGADSAILFSDEAVADKSVVREFWHQSPIVRRERLMPFFWNTIHREGQLYGNRLYKNHMNCANPYWFSYPGYSEMLVGFVDKQIRSNQKIENPQTNILDFINKQSGFEGEVAAFSTWDVIPYVIRASSAGIFTNSGEDKSLHDKASEREVLLNELQSVVKNPYGERYDAFTFFYALAYLKREKPRVMLLSFDETDEHAHGGRYDEYLKSAHNADKMIRDLWHWLQQQEHYKNKTTLLITTDHGRGKGAKNGWKNHGRLSSGSSQTWLAVVGPDTPSLGEIKTEAQYYQKQIAKTAAALLGLDYTNKQPVGNVIEGVMFDKNILADVMVDGPWFLVHGKSSTAD